MSRQPRGAYRHKITLSVEETAHGRTVPRELRAQFYRLLDSVCREGKRAAENPRAQVLIDKLRPQLDTLLNHLYAKPQCQLSLIFTACHAAAVMAMVERGRECGRKEGRMRMERQHLLGERLTKAHREFQRVLKQPTFSPDP